MKYVTMWTPDFKNPMRRLLTTAFDHDVDLYHKPIPKDRSWRAIVKMKPRFIFNCMNQFKKDAAIVWIDADSMFIKNPGYFASKAADLVYRPWVVNGVVEPIASVLYFKNTPQMRGFVGKWAKNTEALSPQTQRPEQRSLCKLMWETVGVKKRQFAKNFILPKWIGPQKNGHDVNVASIWTTRWYGHNVKKSEEHAYVEKRHRDEGIWTAERWLYGV